MDGTVELSQPMDLKQRRWPYWLMSLAGFFMLALVSAQLPFPGLPLPAVWLPSGLALALFLRHGSAIWPLVGIGSVIAVATQGWFWHHPLGLADFLLGFILVLTTVGEAILVALALRHMPVYRQPLMNHFSSYLWLIGVCTPAAFVGALAMAAVVLAITPSDLSFSNLILSRFFADFIGILIVVPLLFTQRSTPTLYYLWRRPMEWIVWLLTLVLLTTLARHQQIQIIYLVSLLMIWAATRFSLPGSMIAIALSSIVATAESLAFFGDAKGAFALSELLLLQALIAVMVGTSTYVRVLLEDRRRVETNLENMIEERTRELQIRNFELRDEIYVREQAEKSFRRSNKHYRALVETASNPIIVIDETNTIRQWNSAAESLFGYSRDEAIGKNLLDTFIPEVRRDEMAWKITKVRSSGLLNESIEAEAHGYDGSVHIMLWNINRLQEEDEDVRTQLILIGQDITEIRETQDKLHFLAHYDALTGTANRRLFEDRCHQVIETALRYNHRSALISLDVDHFKRINDTFGHDAGDELLREIADRLRDSVRKEDTISRMGGDEFAVLLNRVNGREGCEKVARAILDNITRPIKLPSGELVITSSLGITMAPDDAQSYEDLLKNADMAMYRAKNAGRNTIQFFSKDMNDEMRRQLTVEAELRQAIEAGHLHLYYQPLLDTVTGQIVSLEALLRWHHPTKGVLRPHAFLDVAEQSGQLLELGEWVCYNACLQARAIQTMSGMKIPVSINLSSRQYHHPQLCATLARIIRETHIDPGMLCIEVDEKTLSERLSEAPATLKSIKELGVQVILDRFGSGLSSVRLLRELPFDQVKIDGALLRDVPQDAAATTVVQTLLNLALQMHFAISISGVETEAQLQLVAKQGCRLMQGHLFSQAIPNDQLADLFEQIRQGRNLARDREPSLLGIRP
jgi:diguanylate cyclase (GGDEF)-like protein/PAS domain S-box-containing protein